MKDEDQVEHLNFITNLSGELSEVDVFLSAEKRSFVWIVVHFLFIAVMMMLFQPFRNSLGDDIFSIKFQIEIALFFVSLFIAGYFSFLSFVPGAILDGKMKFVLVPIFFLVIFLFGASIYTSFSGDALRSMRKFCEFEILLYSILPLVHMFYMVKKGQNYFNKWSIVAASLASTLIPATLMHMACAYDYTHLLIFHLGPVAFVTVMGYLLSRKVFIKS
jgi:hypothetical protein